VGVTAYHFSYYIILLIKRITDYKCRITYIIFFISTKYWKGLRVIISKLRSGMYIFLLYSLTIAQWWKITELGYRCATTVSFKETLATILTKKNYVLEIGK
jgi:hypothetical protein